jgi:hypothetical protein
VVLLSKRNGILAFAFGEGTGTFANATINYITCTSRSRLLGAPIFTQRDVAVSSDTTIASCAKQAREDPPPPTLRIAREAVYWARFNGITKLFIVAAPPHLWRAIRDTKKAIREIGADTEVVALTAQINEISSKAWYCQNPQPRTTSRLKWWPREITLRLMPFWFYKRVRGVA